MQCLSASRSCTATQLPTYWHQQSMTLSAPAEAANSHIHVDDDPLVQRRRHGVHGAESLPSGRHPAAAPGATVWPLSDRRRTVWLHSGGASCDRSRRKSEQVRTRSLGA